MTAYWVLFACFAALALLPWPPQRPFTRLLAVSCVGVALSIFVGLRFEIGADWYNYEAIFLDISRANIFGALEVGDPGYSLINWIIAQLGGQVWHVNLICATFFSYALLRLCVTLPSPGVALVSAVPTLIIVVAMGYTRQATAVAIVMMAICSFNGAFNWKWLAWLTLAVTFHKSAIVAVPLFFVAATKNKKATLVAGAGLGVALLMIFVVDSFQAMMELYFGGDMQSSGTYQRAVLAILPAVAFFALPGRQEILGEKYKLWRNFAIGSISLAPLLVAISSSTVVDRIGVLLLPFQITFYSIVPFCLAKTKVTRHILIGIIVFMNFAILGVWLYFADNATQWIPYRNVINEPYL